MIRPNLSDLINNHKTQGERKIHLKIPINFISSKNSDENRTMHSKSDNIEIMMGSETDEIIEECFESLLKGYEKVLEESMRGSEFIFYSANILHYNFNKISLVRGGIHIDTPERIKNKKVPINQRNNDDKCFLYGITAALNIEQIKNHAQRISNIEPFINQYNWKETNFPLNKK